MRDSYLPRCPLDPLTKKSQICVRFKKSDALDLTRAAARRGMRRAEWMRSLLLKRADTKSLSPLTCSTADGGGQMILIRLTTEDLKRVEEACGREVKETGWTLSAWVRAICLGELK